MHQSALDRSSHGRLILFQVRRMGDPVIPQERGCFTRWLGVTEDELEVIDVLTAGAEAMIDAISDPRAIVLIGGSGDFSVSQGGPRSQRDFIERVVPALIELQRPTLGVCWGLHAMVAGVGGRVERVGEGEIGTFEVRLTETGQVDPLFSALPQRFRVQLGHRDWVTALPEGAHALCENDATPYQAVRFGDGAVYGVQFHPELDIEDHLVRFRRYSNYYAPEEAEALQRGFDASPEANGLLSRFLAHHSRRG